MIRLSSVATGGVDKIFPALVDCNVAVQLRRYDRQLVLLNYSRLGVWKAEGGAEWWVVVPFVVECIR